MTVMLEIALRMSSLVAAICVAPENYYLNTRIDYRSRRQAAALFWSFTAAIVRTSFA